MELVVTNNTYFRHAGLGSRDTQIIGMWKKLSKIRLGNAAEVRRQQCDLSCKR